MTQPTTHVHSPAGIRLVSGLLGPYLTPSGQEELSTFWDTSVDDLFTQAVLAAEDLADLDALHAALGVWVRNHRLPSSAAEQLAAFVQQLPDDNAAAQAALDGWAAEHTAGMIPTFPCTVTDDTRAVLASALAVDDTWERPAADTRVAFQDQRVRGFKADTPRSLVRCTAAGTAVRATLPLTSGLTMSFCIHQDGPAAALEQLLNAPNYFYALPTLSHPMISSRPVYTPTGDVAILVPSFTITSSLDIAADAAAWGLEAALRPGGVPGLGNLEVSEARQDAFIEVSHTGVRAAAVTAMVLARSANMMTPQHQQLAVEIDQPFAFALTHPDIEAPLFTGIYAG